MGILVTILSITGISTVLSIMIVVAERFLNDYGECEIDINEGQRKIVTEGGSSLLSSLAQNKIFISSACGGKATCGLCKVRVVEGGGPILPTEEPFMSEEEKKEGVRLSCQVKIKGNIKITIPEALFNVREYNAKVARITDLTHDIKEIRLEVDEEVNFKAGQFMQLESKPYDKVRERAIRAYSISSVPSNNKVLEFIIRRVPGGICTTYVFDHLKEGDTVRITGPYGEFYRRDDSDQYIFMAGGSGLAPVKSIILDIIEKGLDKKMILFFGAVTKKDLYYTELFEKLEKENENFRYVPALSNPLPEDGWDGEVGLVTDVMKKHVDDGKGKHAYLCGSPGMIGACVKALTSVDFNEEKIYYDKF